MSSIAARLLAASAVGGVVLAAGVVPAVASTPSTASATAKTAGCKDGTLPSPILGNPKVKAQGTEGVYMFHDAQGYEVKVTHPGKTKVVFAGTLYAGRGFAKLDKLRLEKGDFATESADHKQIDFRFTDFGGIDGFHAYADCSAVVRATFRIDGKTAGTTQVFLGKDKLAPTSVPFTIDRTKPAKDLSAAA